MSLNTLSGLSGLSGIIGPGKQINPSDYNPILWLDPSDGVYKDGAMDFNGTNQYGSKGDAQSFPLRGGDFDFYFGGWVNLDTKTSSRAIMGKHNTAGNLRSYVVLYNSTVDRFRFTVSPDGISTSTIDANNLGSPSTGTWYFVLCWHDSVNNTINIKVNGGTTNSVSYSTGIYPSTADFEIARVSSGSYLDGKLDSLFFGKITGLAGLISSIDTRYYNSGNGISYSDLTTSEKTTFGLVSWWDLDNSGTDQNSGIDLTLFNSPTWVAGIVSSLASANDPVSKWIAKTGQIFSSSAVSKRPTYKLGNNGYYLSFDGVDDTLTGDSLTDLTNVEAAELFVNNRINSLEGDDVIIQFKTNSGTSRAVLLMKDLGGTQPSTYRGNTQIGGRRLDSDSYQGITSNLADYSSGDNNSEYGYDGWYTKTGLLNYTDAEAEIYQNIALGNEGVFQTPGNTSNTSSSSGPILASDGSNFYQMDIGDIIVYNTKLYDTQRNKVEKFLISRRG